MSQKMFSVAAALIFLVVAIAHLMRLVLGWSVIINGWAVPMWMSIVALVAATFLAFRDSDAARDRGYSEMDEYGVGGLMNRKRILRAGGPSFDLEFPGAALFDF